jgi:hypothetical protein
MRQETDYQGRQTISPGRARQGSASPRVLKVLVISLAIAMIVWGAIEVYYRTATPPEESPQSQMLQNDPAAPAPSSE